MYVFKFVFLQHALYLVMVSSNVIIFVTFVHYSAITVTEVPSCRTRRKRSALWVTTARKAATSLCRAPAARLRQTSATMTRLTVQPVQPASTVHPLAHSSDRLTPVTPATSAPAAPTRPHLLTLLLGTCVLKVTSALRHQWLRCLVTAERTHPSPA